MPENKRFVAIKHHTVPYLEQKLFRSEIVNILVDTILASLCSNDLSRDYRNDRIENLSSNSNAVNKPDSHLPSSQNRASMSH